MFGFGRGAFDGAWQRRAFHRGPGHGPGNGPAHFRHGFGGPGVRRPLRFLIDRLGLDDGQAAVLSKAFEALRLEREQAALDERRAKARIADLFEADTLDAQALEAATAVRVAAAERARVAAVDAITKVHAALTPEQRQKLAMVLRNGPFSL